jgi:hypothetical protein
MSCSTFAFSGGSVCIDRSKREWRSPLQRSHQTFDEISVYEGIAERTGNTADRTSIRGRQGICRSLTELSGKVRRLGDGYYYLAAMAWPENEKKLVLRDTWTPMS